MPAVKRLSRCSAESIQVSGRAVLLEELRGCGEKVDELHSSFKSIARASQATNIRESLQRWVGNVAGGIFEDLTLQVGEAAGSALRETVKGHAAELHEACRELGQCSHAHVHGDASDTDLPLQLSRFSARQMKSAREAIAVLEQAGLDKIDNVQDLHDKVAQLARKIDSCSSSYELMCRWAQTPALWCRADRLDAKVNCKLEGLTDEERTAKRTELEAWRTKLCTPGAEQIALDAQMEEGRSYDLDIMHRCFRRDKFEKKKGLRPRNNAEHYKAWVDSQFHAERELRLLASDVGHGFGKFLGNGRKVLFDFQPGGQMKPAPQKKRYVPAVTPWQEIKKEVSDNDSKVLQVAKRALAGSRPAIITIHVGTAGCMMANSYWKQVTAEHRLNSDGTYSQDPIGCLATSYIEKAKGSLLPRALLVDAGANNVDLSGCIKPDEVIRHSGVVTDWGSSSMGEYTGIIDTTMEKMRCQLEQCDAVDSLLMAHALYEDFGGALSSHVIQKLREENPKVTVWAFPLISGNRKECSAREIHNTSFGLYCGIESCDLVTYADQACAGAPVKSSHEEMAHLLAACSNSMRLGSAIPACHGSHCVHPSTMARSLCPFPRLNMTFPVSLSAACNSIPADYMTKQDFSCASHFAFRHGNLLSQSISPENGKFVCMGLYFNGMDIKIQNRQIAWIKENHTFSLPSLRFQVERQSGTAREQMVGICNSTCFKQVLNYWHGKLMPTVLDRNRQMDDDLDKQLECLLHASEHLAELDVVSSTSSASSTSSFQDSDI